MLKHHSTEFLSTVCSVLVALVAASATQTILRVGFIDILLFAILVFFYTYFSSFPYLRFSKRKGRDSFPVREHAPNNLSYLVILYRKHSLAVACIIWIANSPVDQLH